MQPICPCQQGRGTARHADPALCMGTDLLTGPEQRWESQPQPSTALGQSLRSHWLRTWVPVGSSWGHRLGGLSQAASSSGDAHGARARGDTGQKRGDKWKGQLGPGAGAAARDQGGKLTSEAMGWLTGAVSPGAPTSAALPGKVLSVGFYLARNLFGFLFFRLPHPTESVSQGAARQGSQGRASAAPALASNTNLPTCSPTCAPTPLPSSQTSVPS